MEFVGIEVGTCSNFVCNTSVLGGIPFLGILVEHVTNRVVVGLFGYGYGF